MTTRRTLLQSATAIVALSMTGPAIAQSNEPIPVVATFSILGDMVKRIGGDHVDVTTLVGPNGDAHVYQPTPQAARAVSETDMLVLNGLNFEGWIDRLVEASDFDGTQVVVSAGITPIAFGDGDDDAHEDDHDDDDHAEEHDDHDHDDHDHEMKADAGHDHDHGASDPHAWQSLGNAVIYVDNITAALAQTDPGNAGTFYANREAYVSEIETLDAEIRDTVASLPEDRRIVVTSHDAFQYFARDYGITFLSPQGISTESEASARDVAQLIETMRAENVGAVFFENIADSRLLEQIADETDATIGGTLYPGALSDADGPAPTYLDLMRHNAATLAQALGS